MMYSNIVFFTVILIAKNDLKNLKHKIDWKHFYIFLDKLKHYKEAIQIVWKLTLCFMQEHDNYRLRKPF